MKLSYRGIAYERCLSRLETADAEMARPASGKLIHFRAPLELPETVSLRCFRYRGCNYIQMH